MQNTKTAASFETCFFLITISISADINVFFFRFLQCNKSHIVANTCKKLKIKLVFYYATFLCIYVTQSTYFKIATNHT